MSAKSSQSMRTLSGLSGVVSSWRLLLALLVAGTATISSVQDSSAQEQQRPRQPQAQQSEQQPAEQRQGESRGSVLRLLPADSVTEHSVDIPGGKLAYTATAGTLALHDQSGERSAAIYYTAYVAKIADRANRPITSPSTAGRCGLGLPDRGARRSRIASSSATTPRPPNCRTTRRPGSLSRTW
jgi:type II secretory pathway component PulL